MHATRAQQIAGLVRDARARRGWSQAELADKVGVHKQTIGNLERASHATQPELLERISKELDVDLSAAAQAGQVLIDVIVDDLTALMRELGESRGLRMAADVLQFVAEWKDAHDPPESRGRQGA